MFETENYHRSLPIPQQRKKRYKKTTLKYRTNLDSAKEKEPQLKQKFGTKTLKFVCNFPRCGMIFKFKSNLSRHEKRAHITKRSKKSIARAAAQYKKKCKNVVDTLSQKTEAIKPQQIVQPMADFRDNLSLPIEVVIESQSIPFAQLSNHSHFSLPSPDNGETTSHINETPRPQSISSPNPIEEFPLREKWSTNPNQKFQVYF